MSLLVHVRNAGVHKVLADKIAEAIHSSVAGDDFCKSSEPTILVDEQKSQYPKDRHQRIVTVDIILPRHVAIAPIEQKIQEAVSSHLAGIPSRNIWVNTTHR